MTKARGQKNQCWNWESPSVYVLLGEPRRHHLWPNSLGFVQVQGNFPSAPAILKVVLCLASKHQASLEGARLGAWLCSPKDGKTKGLGREKEGLPLLPSHIFTLFYLIWGVGHFWWSNPNSVGKETQNQAICSIDPWISL